MATYLGDFTKYETVYHQWETTDASGNSVNPTSNGTLIAYKNSNAAQSTTGISGFIGWDSFTGIHNLEVDTSGAFFTTGDDYSIVLSGATIDSRTVSSVICRFSIENRSDTPYNELVSGSVVGGVPMSGANTQAIGEIASGVWEQNVDNGDFTSSGQAGQKLESLHMIFAGACQIVSSGTQRYMRVYNNDTPTGTPIYTFRLWNVASSDPTISTQTITGRNRITT